MHRTNMNMARWMVFASGLPLSFYGNAVQYAAYALNRSPKMLIRVRYLRSRYLQMCQLPLVQLWFLALHARFTESEEQQRGLNIGIGDDTKCY